MVVDVDIVGLATFGSTLAVLTEGTPYVVQGLSPDSMTMERMESYTPCLSRRGIVDLGYAAAFPSNDGLAVISPSSCEIVSRGLFTREQWRALRPDTFVASAFGGRYIFLHDGAAVGDTPAFTAKGISVAQGGTPDMVRLDVAAIAIFYDVPSGAFYLLAPDGVTIKEFEDYTADPATFLWRSGVVTIPMTNFGAFLITAEAGDLDLTMRVYADGGLKHTTTTRNAPGRLPSGFLAREWEIELEGDATVYGVALASTMEELMDG